MWPLRARTLLLPLLLLLAPAARASHVHGCNESAPADIRLLGQKLRISSIAGYPSYSDFDANGTFLQISSLDGTPTFDYALLAQLQELLGFTYDSVELVARDDGESWSCLLYTSPSPRDS